MTKESALSRRSLVASLGGVIVPFGFRRVQSEIKDSRAEASATSMALPDSQTFGLDGLVRYMSRYFTISGTGLEEFLTGQLAGVVAMGLEFQNNDLASSAMSEREDLVRFMLELNGAPPTNPDLREASVGRVGEERVGLYFTMPLDDETEEFAVSLVAVRQESFLQLLMGFSSAPAMSSLAEIAEQLEARWPSESIVNMLPELEDMPTGMELQSEEEIP